MRSLRCTLLGICLTAALVRTVLGADASGEIVVLPKFVVAADSFVFSMSWHCRWPTQKSKITRAWFTNVPQGGMVEKAGIQNDDQLLKYDGAALADLTGEWLSNRLKQPWKPGEVHELLVERKGQKLSMTIEVTAKAKKTPGPSSAGRGGSP